MISGSRKLELKSGAVRLCPACGAAPIRDSAIYCIICGKILDEEYQPLDALRSSHRLQGRSFLIENSETEEVRDLFETNGNSASEMAWASFVYSLVPYLGILFIPATFVIGTVGVGVSIRHPKFGGGRLSLVSMALSVLTLAVQLFLWWLLYKIPDLRGQI